jgi:hypothetical protein
MVIISPYNESAGNRHHPQVTADFIKNCRKPQKKAGRTGASGPGRASRKEGNRRHYKNEPIVAAGFFGYILK